MLPHHAPAQANNAPLLRPYPPASPQAEARLVILALLADDCLDSQELDYLARRQAFEALGLSRQDFFQVFYELCTDLAHGPDRNLQISPAQLEELLAGIQEPCRREVLLGLIFDAIRNDGRLAEGEAAFFWRTLDAWNLKIEQATRRLRSLPSAKRMPRRLS